MRSLRGYKQPGIRRRLLKYRAREHKGIAPYVFLARKVIVSTTPFRRLFRDTLRMLRGRDSLMASNAMGAAATPGRAAGIYLDRRQQIPRGFGNTGGIIPSLTPGRPDSGSVQ
jgi:hypothetical protein